MYIKLILIAYFALSSLSSGSENKMAIPNLNILLAGTTWKKAKSWKDLSTIKVN